MTRPMAAGDSFTMDLSDWGAVYDEAGGASQQPSVAPGGGKGGRSAAGPPPREDSSMVTLDLMAGLDATELATPTGAPAGKGGAAAPSPPGNDDALGPTPGAAGKTGKGKGAPQEATKGGSKGGKAAPEAAGGAPAAKGSSGKAGGGKGAPTSSAASDADSDFEIPADWGALTDDAPAAKGTQTVAAAKPAAKPSAKASAKVGPPQPLSTGSFDLPSDWGAIAAESAAIEAAKAASSTCDTLAPKTVGTAKVGKVDSVAIPNGWGDGLDSSSRGFDSAKKPGKQASADRGGGQPPKAKASQAKAGPKAKAAAPKKQLHGRVDTMELDGWDDIEALIEDKIPQPDRSRTTSNASSLSEGDEERLAKQRGRMNPKMANLLKRFSGTGSREMQEEKAAAAPAQQTAKDALIANDSLQRGPRERGEETDKGNNTRINRASGGKVTQSRLQVQEDMRHGETLEARQKGSDPRRLRASLGRHSMYNHMSELQHPKPSAASQARPMASGGVPLIGTPLFRDARQMAALREIVEGATVAENQQGPEFTRSVWEYYSVMSHWSDGFCVGIQRKDMLLWTCVPCMWPVRLYRTLRRAAPITCMRMKVVRGCACPVAFSLFAFPFAVMAALLWYRGPISSWLRDRYAYGRAPVPVVWFCWLMFFVLFLTAYVWARLLLGVGHKYNILTSLERPQTFLSKATSCICTFNVRVGLHVDRAQGYAEALRTDKTLVELSDQLRSADAPQQADMV